MVTVNSNIKKFNLHIKGQLDSLNAHGAQTQDLLSNLFKGYKAASNREFRAYIAKKEDKYNEGTDIKPNHLMKLALNKYKTLLESKQWNAKSMEDSQIIALEAKIKWFQDNCGNSKTMIYNPECRGPQPQNNCKQHSKPGVNKGSDWRHIAPKQDKQKKKSIQGQDYWWCPNHQRWVNHQPSECKGLGLKQTTSARPQKEAYKGQAKTHCKELKLSRALAAIAKHLDSKNK